jgi:predicted GNAT superfamily acetyltransferase
MSSETSRASNAPDTDVVIRECTTAAEFDACVHLQREVFGLPDLEVSPRRHLIVSQQAGGWTLGAFQAGELVGFVHHLAAVRGEEVFGYSHMMAVAESQQNKGLGARLKWAQRERALAEGRSFIKWTWDPMRARNAHFNLNRLGTIVRAYSVNFYGTDYTTTAGEFGKPLGLDSDRLFAEWHLRSPRVEAYSRGDAPPALGEPAATVVIPPDWPALMREDISTARRELLRVRTEFQQAFAAGLVCAGFMRDDEKPRYLFYESIDGDRRLF